MRMLKFVSCVTLLLTLSTLRPATAQNPMAGDLIFGLNTPCANDLDMDMNTCDPNIGEFSDTLELVRGLQGTPAPVAGFPLAMTPTTFIQSVEFDNLNGMSHNAEGNILGLNFGPDSMVGGAIYSFGTDGTSNEGQLIGMPSTGLGGSVTTSRLAGLSVSPDNSKIAMSAFNLGSVFVYDYTAGDGSGSGAALSGGRETASATLAFGTTSGTAWIDNNTIVAMDPVGSVFTVDATSMAATFQTSVPGYALGSRNAALVYNGDISPYVFASISLFDGATNNRLFVLDPDNGYSVVNTFDFDMESQTSREIAFDADGNLYIGGFSSTVSVINDAAANAATITAADISTDIYQSGVFSSFNGFDIALTGGSTMITGDFNMDGAYDCLDVDGLVAAIASGAGDPAVYDLTGDTVVDQADLTAWLAEAGMINEGVSTYLVGDANLDTIVDGLDFIDWNDNKFTNTPAWCSGDFNADGVVDGLDFIEWNNNKFMSASDLASVPEPAGLTLVLLGLACLRRRR